MNPKLGSVTQGGQLQAVGLAERNAETSYSGLKRSGTLCRLSVPYLTLSVSCFCCIQSTRQVVGTASPRGVSSQQGACNVHIIHSI